ncbi:hypothetical protein GCM10010329_13140 [Streptomyces spiroverticillatus]|uniref:Uncharacterized protein n=1 Tax=Streptomyces finlayi TaxID=67296 RepID=A0A919C9U2_9ACTN|nr:hypothetical protein [Streptomyces finlayi]GGZ93488.1 hypothetical protein GCM10010329_13140 [Streptomyces spiroverticillatus]GHC92286.1 hypothetical protein GCM10010334_27960 [Streptomyces finlayi]
MAAHEGGTRYGRRAVLALGGLLAASCALPSAPADTASRDVRRLLDRRAAALLTRDRAAFLDVLAPGAQGLRSTQGEEFDHLAGVPLKDWHYRLTGLDRTGVSAVTARVELRYRIDGYDAVPAVSAHRVDLVREDGQWYVTGDRPGRSGAQELWQQGPVTVARGRRSVVLGTGHSTDRLRRIAEAADGAADAVARTWTREEELKTVLLVPPSLNAMGALLGEPAAGYRGIAAVTTGASDRGRRTSADRVIVNPEAYDVLGAVGRQVVLTHETTHVATRTDTTAATPMWLSEGFADWVAYRDSDRTPAQIAPELQRTVRSEGPPAALPADEDFRFAGDADRLAGAYEGGWLACRMIVERRDAATLLEFYRTVGAHPQRDGAVEAALQRHLGTTPQEFTARWRSYVRDALV